MEVWTPERLWARIEELARTEPTGLVATDGDGTLWSGDVGEDLFHGFLQHAAVEPVALEALRVEARGHHLSDAGSGPDIAHRLYSTYLAGHFPEERICEIMTWCFAGWDRGRARAFARDVVAAAGLEGRLQREVVEVIERARAAGLRVVLVSASPEDVVIEAGARIGFGEGEVVAARPRFERGVMLPDVERPIPYADGKVSRLRERMGEGSVLLAAMGDNVFDLPLLASARLGVAVRPKPRLCARAHELPGLVELARAGADARPTV